MRRRSPSAPSATDGISVAGADPCVARSLQFGCHCDAPTMAQGVMWGLGVRGSSLRSACLSFVGTRAKMPARTSLGIPLKALRCIAPVGIQMLARLVLEQQMCQMAKVPPCPSLASVSHFHPYRFRFGWAHRRIAGVLAAGGTVPTPPGHDLITPLSSSLTSAHSAHGSTALRPAEGVCGSHDARHIAARQVGRQRGLAAPPVQWPARPGSLCCRTVALQMHEAWTLRHSIVHSMHNPHAAIETALAGRLAMLHVSLPISAPQPGWRRRRSLLQGRAL